MPHPNAIEPSWAVTWCPFCYWTFTYEGAGWTTNFADKEQVIEEHLAEHVEEMMAEVL